MTLRATALLSCPMSNGLMLSKFFPEPTGELYGWLLATLVFNLIYFNPRCSTYTIKTLHLFYLVRQWGKKLRGMVISQNHPQAGFDFFKDLLRSMLTCIEEKDCLASLWQQTPRDRLLNSEVLSSRQSVSNMFIIVTMPFVHTVIQKKVALGPALCADHYIWLIKTGKQNKTMCSFCLKYQ